VIVASGAKLKRLGVPGEAALEYKGVSQCADCDGPMFKGQVVTVVGGGDSALQEALVLSRYCSEVHVIHRELRARQRWIEAISACRNVRMKAQSEVVAIEGADRVEAVRVRWNGQDIMIPCAGVFAYIGLAPATDFLPANAQRDAKGALFTDDSLETTLRNVFAAGAVRAGFGGTLADAVRDAARACDSILANVR
jgi:thioredoxin reductase (NADPH)